MGHQSFINHLSTIYQPSMNYLWTNVNHLSNILNHLSTIYKSPINQCQPFIDCLWTIYWSWTSIYQPIISHLLAIYKPSFNQHQAHISQSVDYLLTNISHLWTIRHQTWMYHPSNASPMANDGHSGSPHPIHHCLDAGRIGISWTPGKVKVRTFLDSQGVIQTEQIHI